MLSLPSEASEIEFKKQIISSSGHQLLIVELKAEDNIKTHLSISFANYQCIKDILEFTGSFTKAKYQWITGSLLNIQASDYLVIKNYVLNGKLNCGEQTVNIEINVNTPSDSLLYTHNHSGNREIR